MSGHHLIIGQLTDYISGKSLDDTLDERYRQKIAQILVTQKNYDKTDITPRHELILKIDKRCARLWITYSIVVDNRVAMIIHYGPGSLVTRHRPTLAMSRIVETYQVPIIVVTNGESADIIDATSGKLMATGLNQIPNRHQLAAIGAKHLWETISPKRREMEARILMAFEVDDRCPCDDSICNLKY